MKAKPSDDQSGHEAPADRPGPGRPFTDVNFTASQLLSSPVALQLLRAELLLSPLAAELWMPLLALLPFVTVGEDWVTLLDDGSATCHKRTLTNSSDEPMQFEVTWDRDQDPVETITVPPRSSIVIVCAVRKLRVRGTAGSRGNWQDTESLPAVHFRGSGTVFTHGGTEGGLHPACRTFEIRNAGREPITIRMKRKVGDAEPQESEVRVHPGNTVVLRCRIYRLSVERGEDDAAGTTYVREIGDE